MNIWQVVHQDYDGYDVLATYANDQQAQLDLSARIEVIREKALQEFHTVHTFRYPKWTEDDYLKLCFNNASLDVYEFEIEPDANVQPCDQKRIDDGYCVPTDEYVDGERVYIHYPIMPKDQVTLAMGMRATMKQFHATWAGEN